MNRASYEPMRRTRAIQVVVAVVVFVCFGLFVSMLQDPLSASTTEEAVADYGDRSLTVTSPVSYQVIQRDSVANDATIHIEGTYVGTPTAVEARWGSGAFQTIDEDPSYGMFSGSLAGQHAGQSMLTVRFADDPSTEVAVHDIGVGDIFVVAGQSNASGRGASMQQYVSTNGVIATLFGNDDTWKVLQDPYDSADGQVDAASIDNAAAGSIIPLLASRIVAHEKVPVAFVPAARGATTIEQWQPSDSPATLYGSMKRRIAAVGGNVRAVLWFQGESDAKRGTSQEAYVRSMSAMIDQIVEDVPGVLISVGQIGQARFPAKNLEAIRRAQMRLWYEHPAVLQGPVTYDIDLGDDGGDMLHFQSDEDLEMFAERWWRVLQHELYHNPAAWMDSLTRTASPFQTQLE